MIQNRLMIQNRFALTAFNASGLYSSGNYIGVNFRGSEPDKELQPKSSAETSPETAAPKPDPSLWQKTQHGAGVVWNGTKRFFKKISRPKVLQESVVQGAKEVKHVWKKDFCDASPAGKAKHLGWEGLGLTVAAAFFWFPGPSPAILISPSCRSFAAGFWKDTPTEKSKSEKAQPEKETEPSPI